MPKKTTVCIVEDDPAFRASLVDAVSSAPGLVVTGVASDRRSGMAMLTPANAAHVLLVDLGLPDGNGLDLIEHAQQVWPRCQIMVISVFAQEHKIFDALMAGATGYLFKSGGLQALHTQIADLLGNGPPPMSPGIARRVLDWSRQLHQGCADLKKLGLSKRQEEIVTSVLHGYSYPEIAEKFQISVNTVNTHIKRVYGKLQVSSITELRNKLQRRNLFDDPQKHDSDEPDRSDQ